ncbi:hypothetical protein [Sigmofec virus UA08Rod_6641]|uniref:Uncharacterized protein n=1 Tax=Sigmofec virus UA08Rod_6641 TaxID=2929236 RepID=A0A976N0W9_9VIRU|nr:hypothetical protein [Sigmofec virus UA08Rod_6641]
MDKQTVLTAAPSADLSIDKLYVIIDTLSGDIIGNVIRAKNDAIVSRDFVSVITKLPYPDDVRLICLGEVPPLNDCALVMTGSQAKALVTINSVPSEDS